MRKFVPWGNLITFGGMMLLCLTTAVIVSFGSNPVAAYIAVWASTAGFIGVFLAILIGWLRDRPDFIVRGAGVWVERGVPVDAALMERALDFYVHEVAKLAPTLPGDRVPPRQPEVLRFEAQPGHDDSAMASLYPQAQESWMSYLLVEMLSGARIVWSKDPVSSFTRFWQIHDVNGLQKGKGIEVRWMGSVSESALFHELHHMVDEIILRRSPDYKHEAEAWWDSVRVLKAKFKPIEEGLQVSA